MTTSARDGRRETDDTAEDDPRGSPPGNPEPAVSEARTALPKALRILGSVVAPATLVTALMFFFGQLHVAAFAGYFGVNYTALDMTLQDYLTRSADGLFVPVVIVSAGALPFVWAHRLLVGRRPQQNRRIVLRVVLPVVGAAGLALVAVATAAVLDPVAFVAYNELPGLALAIGVLLLAYVFRQLSRLTSQGRRSRDPASPSAIVEWAAIFVLVSVGLFWSVGNYAVGVGSGRGAQLAAELGSWPDAVLYSEKDLQLQSPGLRAIPCLTAKDGYRFRYEGLKLVLQSGQQYLFLPSGWTPETGVALLVPRDDTLRLEFALPGASGVALRGTC